MFPFSHVYAQLGLIPGVGKARGPRVRHVGVTNPTSFTLCTPGSLQARHFLDVVPVAPDALAPAVDLELAGNCSERPPRAGVTAELDDFLEAVEGAWGRQVVLYVGEDFEARYPVRAGSDRPLWTRRFLLRPSGEWLIWQLHGYARVDGVEGGVDLDVMRSEE